MKAKFKGFEFKKTGNSSDGWKVTKATAEFKLPASLVTSEYRIGSLLSWAAEVISRSENQYNRFILAVFKDD